MGTDDMNELIYDLVERYDYSDLSELQKQMVLEVMSEAEYLHMRATIVETQLYFKNEQIADVKNSSFKKLKGSNRFIKFMRKPIPFYRVAALFGLIVTLYFGTYFIKQTPVTNEIAHLDPIRPMQADTKYVTIIDTLEVIKERIVYIDKVIDAKESIPLVAIVTSTFDCDNDICPTDIDKWKNLASNNIVSNDTLLKKILETMN